MSEHDTTIVGGRVVFPGQGVVPCDLGITDGRIAAIAGDLAGEPTEERIDATGLFVFPGAVDSHFHLGIYRPIATDATSETRSSLVGGVTSVISYFRTGSHYLSKTGPYREILPEVLDAVAGRAFVDYGFHIAPMTTAQLDEIDWMAAEAGISSFKYYMFYKGLNLAASSADGKSYTMSDSYDFGHLFAMMEKIAETAAKRETPGRVSLSLHCENAELINLFIQRVKDRGLTGLHAYSEARPPLSERLSIHEAALLGDAAGVGINLLHLSSAEALRGAREVRQLYPGLDLRCETTLHHLALTYAELDRKGGLGGKVNPPVRTADDVEALWSGVLRGDIDWVASDHACCMEAEKGDELWPALPGFGGTALLYPVMLSEGHHRRGLPLERVAELVSRNPAEAYACGPTKGGITPGGDADLVLVDLDREATVTPELLHSEQDHTPFEGVKLRGWPVRTLLRGRTAFLDGQVQGDPHGQFLVRPLAVHRAQQAASSQPLQKGLISG
jgi:dihydroorotase-like cyclic amidohydrolase